jgi:hypothetical protein
LGAEKDDLLRVHRFSVWMSFSSTVLRFPSAVVLYHSP